jgi:hypothetical protein
MKISAIGIGQGGTNLADAIATKFGSQALGAINLSDNDLKTMKNISKDNQLHLGNGGVDGAGKQRNFSKQFFFDQQEEIRNLALKIIPGSDVVFVCFSTAGGTGSGLGPAISAYLNSSEFERSGVKSPIVFGIAACADSNEGIKSQQNTIEALGEISNLSERKLARFMLVNNDVEGTVKEIEKKYAAINDKVASYLFRYFTGYNQSRLGCLDHQDRVVGLSLPGVHSFCEFNAENFEDIYSPFILPEGARVLGLFAEVIEGSAPAVESIKTRLGIQVDDSTIGFFEPKTPTFSVIHLAGFSNLRKVTERYQNIISQIQSKSIQADNNDRTNGQGFSRVGANKSWIQDQSTVKKSDGVHDIWAAIGDIPK